MLSVNVVYNTSPSVNVVCDTVLLKYVCQHPPLLDVFPVVPTCCFSVDTVDVLPPIDEVDDEGRENMDLEASSFS